MDSLRVVSGLPHYTTTIAMPRRSQNGNRAPQSRNSNRMRGRGDYHPDVPRIKDPATRLERKIDHLEKKLVGGQLTVNNAASSIGRTLGNFVNQGDLGALAGSSLAKWFGRGDYHLKSNSLMGSGIASGAKFRGDGRRGTRITEREYIGDIISGTLSGSSTLFDVATYTLNPTDPNTFPWLSKLAPLYDQWEPNGIVFEFVSTSSEYNGTSQALGAVIIATDYDAYDPIYLTKQEMENSDYACSTKPANSLLHGIECAHSERPTSILFTNLDNGAPLTSVSLGRTHVATQGCSVAGVTLGELWISYDITFYKKQLTPPSTPESPYLLASGTFYEGGTYWPSTNVINKGVTLTQQIGVGSTINFNAPIGYRFTIVYFVTFGTSADITALESLATTGCTYDLVYSCSISATPPEATWIYDVTITSADATIQCPLNALATADFQLHVYQRPYV